jgi:hypothetical protein
MDPPFDSYDRCIQGTFTEASHEACFEKTLQTNQLTRKRVKHLSERSMVHSRKGIERYLATRR